MPLIPLVVNIHRGCGRFVEIVVLFCYGLLLFRCIPDRYYTQT
jgi:hypothetical protein